MPGAIEANRTDGGRETTVVTSLPSGETQGDLCNRYAATRYASPFSMR